MIEDQEAKVYSGRPDDRFFSPLDTELQQMAVMDWALFCRTIGDDAILSAKICILRKRSLSQNMIAIKLSLTRSQVRTGACKCPELLVKK